MAHSNEITTRKAMQSAYHSLLAASFALETWDRVVGDDDREPIPAMRQELDACRSLSDTLAWSQKWLGGE